MFEWVIVRYVPDGRDNGQKSFNKNVSRFKKVLDSHNELE